jgi:penicillin-binding protein 1A
MKRRRRSSTGSANPKQPKFLYSEFPYFTVYVQKQFEQLLTTNQLEAGGLTVETSLNAGWQRKQRKPYNQAIDRYSGWQGIGQVALVAVDPRYGEIKAMVGNDFLTVSLIGSPKPKRQPGSTFKTFVYTTAIAAGFSPYREYTDARYVVDGYRPKNYGESYSGKVDLIKALRSSSTLSPSSYLFDVGFNPVVNIAGISRIGIESPYYPPTPWPWARRK